MRFALKTAPQHTQWSDMLAVWQAADDMDFFESAWTFDHFYPIFSDSTGPCFEGWTVTTALAQATRRIRVGLLVTGMPYRHPAVLAKMAATLDVVSDGRLELGDVPRALHPARLKEGICGGHAIPSPSGRPNIRLRFWTA